MLKKSALFIGLFFFQSIGFAATLPQWILTPILGVDFDWRYQGFERRFGKEHFRENTLANNFYLGTRFNRCWGMELGYTQTYRREKVEAYNGINAALGFYNTSNFPPLDSSGTEYTVDFITPSTYISDLFTQGWNVNVLGFYPICPKLKTEFYSLAGISFEKMHYSTVPVFEGNPATPVASWSSSRRPVFRAGVGLKQMVTKNFGLRAQAIWEDTSKLGVTVPVSVGQGGVSNPSKFQDFYTVKPQNSYLVGAGFFFQLG